MSDVELANQLGMGCCPLSYRWHRGAWRRQAGPRGRACRVGHRARGIDRGLLAWRSSRPSGAVRGPRGKQAMSLGSTEVRQSEHRRAGH